MTVEDVRNALADACGSISGWRASPYIRDSVAAPEMQISRGVTNYDIVFGRGADEFVYTVTAYVQRDSERAGQIKLDELVDPGSANFLKTVLEQSSTVAAAGVDYIRVREASEVRTADIGNVSYLLVVFTLEVV